MTAPTSISGDTLRLFRRLAALGPDVARLGGLGTRTVFRGAPAGTIDGLERGRPEVARELYSGHFAFARHAVECRPSEVFAMPSPDPGWSDWLHGFGWLADLEATGLALHRAFGRNLVKAWFAQNRRSSFAAAVRRLLCLARYAPFLLQEAGRDWQEQFLRDVADETRRLAHLRPREPAEQMWRAMALLAAGLAFRGGETLRDEALIRLAGLADTVILPDGGPADRNPQSLLRLLADLVPLRDAMERQRVAIPRELNAAIERALPMLRMLCHGDDGLALFQGVEQTSTALVRAIFERDRSFGRPLSQAPQSGYCRMLQGSSLVIVDTGSPAACDSPLAFEFSDGAQRIVGSCGIPLHASPAWRQAACRAAAHSTADIDDDGVERVQSLFQRRSRRKAANPVSAEVIASPAGALVKGCNRSHVAAWGLEHRRELFLAANGRDLRGEDCFNRKDTIEPDWPDTGFALRFHLHPSIKASADRKGSAIMLLLPNRDAWQFSARGGVLSLEESIHLASGGPRACQQIVIRGVAGRPDRVNWAFRKLDRRTKSSGDEADPPRLPF